MSFTFMMVYGWVFALEDLQEKDPDYLDGLELFLTWNICSCEIVRTASSIWVKRYLSHPDLLV